MCWQKNFPTRADETGCCLHGYSQRRACELTHQSPSTQRRISRRDPRTELRQRMHEIVVTRVRYGYRQVHVMSHRSG